jgi:sulfite exporter TauE/SafE
VAVPSATLLEDLALPGPGFEALILGAGAGLVAMGHCAAMCGPLAAFGCAPRGGPLDRAAPVRWLAGRTAAYAVLGALVGGTSGGLAHGIAGGLDRWVSLALGASLLVAAVGFFRRSEPSTLGPRPRAPGLASRLSSFVLSRRPSPFVLGALSGLLPCGALWGGLAAAAATGGAASGALSMLAFSLASAPGLGAFALASSRVERDPSLQRLLGAALIVGALVLVLRPLAQPGAGPSCHGEAPLIGSSP